MTTARAEEPEVTTPPVLGLVSLLAVAAGGAVGALLRHGVDVAFPVAVLGFPWPTLLVNVAGSATLAALGVAPAVRRRPALAGLLGPGVIGGFTTFSAYAEQGRRLVDGGQHGLALGYLLGTLAGCLAGCVAGRLAATGLLARRSDPADPGRVR